MLFRLLRNLSTTKNSDKEFLKVSFLALLRRKNGLTSGFTQRLAGFLSSWRLTLRTFLPNRQNWSDLVTDGTEGLFIEEIHNLVKWTPEAKGHSVHCKCTRSVTAMHQETVELFSTLDGSPYLFVERKSEARGNHQQSALLLLAFPPKQVDGDEPDWHPHGGCWSSQSWPCVQGLQNNISMICSS